MSYHQFPSYFFNTILPVYLQEKSIFPKVEQPRYQKKEAGTIEKLEGFEEVCITENKVKEQTCKSKEEAVGKKEKKYKKDENRNIMPNTIHQIFSFLEKKFKSEQKLKKVLQIFKLEKYCTVKKYYIYQKVLKSKLDNYLTEASIGALFDLVDPSFQIFSLEEQISFIKINGILISYYLRGADNPCRLLCTQKAKRDKKPTYLNANRMIKEIIDEHIVETKRKFNFDLLN